MTAKRWLVAWSALVVCCLLFGLTGLLVWSNDGDLSSLSIGLAMVTTALVGALIAGRRPNNPIGWLLIGSGLAWSVSAFAQQYVDAARRTDLPAADPVSWLIGLWGSSSVQLVLATILFPDGRLPSRRWRPIVWIALLDSALLAAGTQNLVTPLAGGPLLAFLLLSSVAALAIRLRRSSGVERDQLKWIAFGFAFLTVLFLGTTALVKSPFGHSLFGDRVPAVALPVPFAIAFAALPVSIGIAILRHRLYDIDVLINRSLVYGTLSVLLAATYFVSVLAFETVLRPLTAGSEVAVALSTLAVVALVQPLRRRIQDAVDRRFYRARYDAAQTVDAFGVRLRDEVDLEAVRATLLGAVDQSVHPTQASVWLRGRAS
jgi:FtsH-binding integral membrane protein